MFEKLELLSDSDLLKVSHGIFAAWNSCSGAQSDLPIHLSKIIDFIVGKYPKDENEESLRQYVKERTTPILSVDSEKSVKDFFQNSIAPETLYAIPRYITTQPPPIGPEFSYREAMIEKLYNAIKQNQKHKILINGLGGIGKTTVARALYHKVKNDFTYIAWVNYQHSIKESLLNSLTIYDDANEDKESRYRKIDAFLQSATKDCLIFIDNIMPDDEGIRYLECLEASIILTSRVDKLGSFNKFPVDFLTEAQCVDIFYKYYVHDKSQAHKETVRKLVNLVKCHTLSVELLALAANRAGYPLDSYLAELTAKGFEYPDRGVKTKHTTTPHTIAEHMVKLFEMVEVSNEQSRILKNFALFPDMEIPAAVEKWMDCHIDDMKRLIELGWLTESEKGYYMHPIIKNAIQLQHKKPQYEDYAALIEYMSGNEYIKATDVYTDVHDRLRIAEAVMCHLCDVEVPEIGVWFNAIASAYKAQGEYEKALEWFHKASRIIDKVLGTNHPSTATIYNNIATVYNNQSEYEKALEWHHKSLKIRENVLGTNHPDTAIAYNNIASVYTHQGEYEKTLAWYYKALVIFEKVFGTNHPSTTITYNNIASVYDNQGEYERALEWHHKTLKIREKVFGTNHPSTATTYNNMALAYFKQGEYEKALEWYRKALEIGEKVLGTSHPNTAATYNNIASVYDNQGEYETALEWYHKALRIREKVFGTNHPDTAAAYNNIALVHSGQGEYEKALEWSHKALKVVENVLGTNHPSTATNYNNIATVYSRQGKYEKALEWYIKSFHIRRVKLGLNHPHTKTLIKNMQNAYTAHFGNDSSFAAWLTNQIE